ncbi:unnamed protein product [Ambrosiozyma monospora]|uniref:Unnamed protein product n=1 Tax=Ambrosiozyma monospora TaxID=43982 RepID=A0ACB5T2E1_AMBMO|nr:unnamed protein product [Ambrosiozyma monospora]
MDSFTDHKHIFATILDEHRRSQEGNDRSNYALTLKRAYRAVTDYPHAIYHPDQLSQLKFIGPAIMKLVHGKFKKYCSENGLEYPSEELKSLPLDSTGLAACSVLKHSGGSSTRSNSRSSTAAGSSRSGTTGSKRGRKKTTTATTTVTAPDYKDMLTVLIEQEYQIMSSRDNNLARPLKRALDNIRKYPGEIYHPNQLAYLQSVGPKIVQLISDRLKTFCEENGKPYPTDSLKDVPLGGLLDVNALIPESTSRGATGGRKRKTTNTNAVVVPASAHDYREIMATLAENEFNERSQLAPQTALPFKRAIDSIKNYPCEIYHPNQLIYLKNVSSRVVEGIRYAIRWLIGRSFASISYNDKEEKNNI